MNTARIVLCMACAMTLIATAACTSAAPAAEHNRDAANTQVKGLVLETANDVLEFERDTGRLVSFRPKSTPTQEFMEVAKDDPVFVIQYLDETKRYRQIDSLQAEATSVQVEQRLVGQATESMVTGQYRDVAGLGIHVTVKVRASDNDRFARMSISLDNRSGLRITDVQFPMVVVPYTLDGEPGTESIVWPYAGGSLLRRPNPRFGNMESDSPRAWQIEPGDWIASHYPGLIFAQFLAYYNDRVGIYISCEDPSGRVKMVKPVQHKTGIRLGIGHVGDWATKGARELEYEVVLGSFTGDWYDAASIYREWGLKQEWAKVPLHMRKDVPQWLIDSPPHIPFRARGGEIDFGPAPVNEQLFPYEKTIPLLQNIAGKTDSALVPIVFGWEKHGPLTHPDCFPPLGGEEMLRKYAESARERGWHIGTFCSGTRWVTHQYSAGYDGTAYFKKNGGEEAVCRTPDGEPWKTIWDENWRPSYLLCASSPVTRRNAEHTVRTLADIGFEWLQYIGENPGSCAFACFSEDHGHPSTPGYWMTREMYDLLKSLNGIAEEYRTAKDPREVAFSVEFPPAECFIQYFQVCDLHVTPGRLIPLFQFLYHEFILMEDRSGNSPEPYMLQIRNAYNLVMGAIPGAVMKGDGRLQDKDGGDWATWEPQIGDNDTALEVIRTAAALRRSRAKDFLVYGRMLRPSVVEGIERVPCNRTSFDAVVHATWQAPDGRVGVALANWTTEERKVTVVSEALGDEPLLTVSSAKVDAKKVSGANHRFEISLPKLSCAVLESTHPVSQ